MLSQTFKLVHLRKWWLIADIKPNHLIAISRHKNTLLLHFITGLYNFKSALQGLYLHENLKRKQMLHAVSGCHCSRKSSIFFSLCPPQKDSSKIHHNSYISFCPVLLKKTERVQNLFSPSSTTMWNLIRFESESIGLFFVDMHYFDLKIGCDFKKAAWTFSVPPYLFRTLKKKCPSSSQSISAVLSTFMVWFWQQTFNPS